MAGLLTWVVALLTWRGIEGLTTSPGEGHIASGLANALAASFVVVALAVLGAAPLGLAAGVFMAEVGRQGAWVRALRFVVGAFSGMPAVVSGVCVFLLLARWDIAQSMLAGSLALALLLMPMMASTTCRTLEAVPSMLREAALSLGVTPWRALLHVLLRAAAPAMLAAGVLAVARVAGQIAPLLLTMPAGTDASPSADAIPPTLHVEAYRLFLDNPEAGSLAWTAAMVWTAAVVLFVLIAHRFGRRRR